MRSYILPTWTCERACKVDTRAMEPMFERDLKKKECAKKTAATQQKEG